MPDVFAEWFNVAQCHAELKDDPVRFHYVSNSPHQLAPLLHEFLYVYSFPMDTLHLRHFSLLGGRYHPMEHKREVVTRLMTTFPERRFVLVGDSGESDLDLYMLFV